MFNSLCRSARLLRTTTTRTRVTPFAVAAPSTSSFSLLLKPPRICQIAQQRSYAISSQHDGYRAAPRRPSLQDFSEHDPVAEDAEHAFTSVDDITRFQDLLDKNLIDARVVRNITEGMKYDEMTKVQQKTITSTVGGDDVLAQARTGTGKTIAFLLPVLQRIIDSPTPMRQRGVDIRAIIISPTRELAAQIFNDAAKLTKGTNIVTQLAVGGSGKNIALSRMRKEGCHLLIATPGRLTDLLENEQHLVNTEQVDTVVLDEGDTLLDQGFSEAVDKIIGYLPHAAEPGLRGGLGRQTMIFSATMPQKVLDMVRRTLRSNYKFLKMIDKGEATTNTKVKQHLISCHGFENLLPSVYELVMKGLSPPPPPPPPPPPADVATTAEELSGEPEGEAEDGPKEFIDVLGAPQESEIQKIEPFKAIVFFPTAKFASLAASTFKNLALPSDGTPHPLQKFPTFVMHSRLSQSQRTNASDRFRRSKSGILFASDVVARGMDFPNVTHVIQICSPSSREQYIHRLGRTARGSSTSGTGYLLLTSDELRERSVQSLIKSMPLDTTVEVHSSTVQIDQEQELPKLAAEALTNITRASVTTPIEDKASAYLSLLGYFAVIFKDRQVLVDSLNRWSSLGWGLQTPPTVSPRLAQQMGLKGLKGLNHTPDPERRSKNFDLGSGDRRSGGFERRPQRSFDGHREGGFERRPRTFSGPREGGFDRRPQRSFDGPRQEGGGFERRSRSVDGGSEGGYERKPRSFDSREGGGYTRKPRSFDGEDGGGGFERKPRSFEPREGGGGFERKPRSFEPREGGGGFERKPRSFEPREGGSGGFERKPRSFDGPREDGGGFERKPRSFEPREGSSGGFERKPRSFDGPREDGGGFERKPRSFEPREGGGGFERKPRSFDSSPREGGGYERKPRSFSRDTKPDGRPKAPWEKRGTVKKW